MPNQGPVAWSPAEVQEWLRELSLPENVILEFKENAVGGAGGCGKGHGSHGVGLWAEAGRG